MSARRRVRSDSADLHGLDVLRSEGELIPRDFLVKVLQGRAGGEEDTATGDRRATQKAIAKGYAAGRSAWETLQAARVGGVARQAALNNFVQALLRDGLGFDSLEGVPDDGPDADELPLSHRALGGRVPVVVAVGEGLDIKYLEHGRRAARGVKASRRSPFGLLQAYLNRHDEALWGLACDGHHLRLARDHTALTGVAYIEADLDRVFGAGDAAGFAPIWLLMHQGRFGAPGTPAAACALEFWREAGLAAGLRARDRLRDGVARTLELLGTGMLTHPANEALRLGLATGALTAVDLRRDLLRLTYRLIFLITAEARGVLHPADSSAAARDLYARSFALRPLCERAASGQGRDAHGDTWEAVRRIFMALEVGEPRLALPALGAMFTSGHCGTVEQCALSNADFLAALESLTYLVEKRGRVPVSWADIGAEERGSVYEGLLDQEPLLLDGGRRFALGTGGAERKSAGAYYTPSSLVEALLDTALEPALQGAIGERDAGASARLLALRIVDPACGSANFLLAAARRIARHLVELEGGDLASTHDLRHALRRVVTRCIYGADRDGRVLDLVRFGIWLETCVPDLPLPFVDHHLHEGDSIVGLASLEMLAAGIPDDAYRPLTGDDPRACKALRDRNRLERRALFVDLEAAEAELAALAAILQGVEKMPDEAPSQVAAKRAAWVVAAGALANSAVGRGGDALVGAYMAPKVAATGDGVPTSGAIALALSELVGAPTGTEAATPPVAPLPGAWTHWPVRFAHVHAAGGFDVVLANPPWERLALRDKEYFAARDPAVAMAPTAAAAKRRIAALQGAAPETGDRALYVSYVRAKREADASCAFARHPQRFVLAGHGTANTYPLFVETALALRSLKGRAGLIVPSNLGTDLSTRRLFGHLTAGSLESFFDFENSLRIFPAIDGRSRFSLVTIAPASSSKYAFYLNEVGQVRRREKIVEMKPDELDLFNPNTGTVPCFRSRQDLDLARRLYNRVPVLQDKHGLTTRDQALGFANMFHMSFDSDKFIGTQNEKDKGSVTPLYEAKMIHQFDASWATYSMDGTCRDVSENEKANPCFMVSPRHWVDKTLVARKLADWGYTHHCLLGLRVITRATDARTSIASFLPCAGAGHSLLLLTRPQSISLQLLCAVLCNFNSIIFDYLARQKIGGINFNIFTIEQIPFLPLSSYAPPVLDYISSMVGHLYAGSGINALETLAPAGTKRLGPVARAECRAELDAFYAAAYGLDRRDLAFVLDPQNEARPGGPPHPSETFTVLRNQEIERYGEYRTQRLVLEAWDRMEREGTLPPAYTA